MPDETPYNLIDERWIPVRRRSGAVEMVAPAEIADRVDPPLAIQSPRPDFDGALLEFLIGLTQTAAAPRTESLWRQRFEKPPEVAALKADFDTVRRAFFLNGEGPRFMQDLTVAEESDAKRGVPIGALLIDRVGESELDESPTLFAKPGGFGALGYPAAAAALMALQSYAPAGGRGQLTSLRRGGPLTTVVLGEDLWCTVLLNVLPQSQFERLVPGDSSMSPFPWLAPTRTSATKGGRATHPQDVHPAQHFWGLPRRLRLEIGVAEIGRCAITGQDHVPVIRAMTGRPDGVSYEGDFRHPLTPYSQMKPGEPWLAMGGSNSGLPYRDWPQLVTGSTDRAPATVVSYFLNSERQDLVANRRLAAFGYATDKMKPLRWCQATTPLLVPPPERAERFPREVEQLVVLSEEVRRTLLYQVKAAWSDRPKDVPGDVKARVDPAFWSRTEGAFFQSVSALVGAADRAAGDVIREAWLVELHRAALALFDSFAATTVDLATADLGRVVLARRDLANFTSPTNVKLRKTLGLPVAEPVESGKPKRGRSKKTPEKESSS